MSDYELPELPSDEELGIAGMEMDDEEQAPRKDRSDAPPTPSPPPPGRTGGEPRAPAREEPPGPARRWRGPLTLVILGVMAWLASPAWTLPDPVPATAPDTVFSSARGMVRMVELARRAHPPGSPEHTRVREEILDALRELGLEPEVQTATSWVRRGGTLRAATLRNIVARLPGTDPSGAVLVTAHYDGRTLSPGAGDDASGVVAILETLRAVRAGAPLRNDLVVLVTDAEELHLLGARAFVRAHPWMQDVSVVLSLEMRGGGGPSIMFETGADNGWIVEALQAGDPRPMANSLSYEVYRRLPNDTDFTPFREAGRQGLNFAGIGRARVYHQTFDTPENFQEATLQHHGEHLLGMVRELGGRDLGAVDAPDRVFFRLPFLGLVTYGTLWVPVLGVALLLGAVAVVLASLRKGRGWGSLVAGSLLGLAAVGGAAGAGGGIFRWVRGFHPEYGLLQGSAFHSEGWYVLAATALAFTLVAGLFGVARRRASLAGLAAGALFLPLVGALFLTFAAPLAAMNLQWPVLAALAGTAAVIGVAGPRPPGPMLQVLLVLPAAGVVAFMEPLTELIWMAMNVSALPVLAGLAAFGFLLLVPFLDALAEPNRWWAPLTGLVLAAAFLGIGLLQARPSPERPTPSMLAYALDREGGEARWVSRPGPGLEWARERAGGTLEETGTLEEAGRREGAGGVGEETGAAEGGGPEGAARGGSEEAGGGSEQAAGALEAFLVDGGPFLTGPAPVIDVEPPEAATVGEPSPADSVAAGVAGPPASGWTRVALRSRIGAEMMAVRAEAGDEVRWRALNGESIGGRPPTTIVHWGTPVDAVLLDLEVPPGADSVRLVVVEHHLRPAELVGEEPFRRPPDLVPAVNPPMSVGADPGEPGGLSDRALIRTVLTLPVTPGSAAVPGAADTAGVSTDTAAADTGAAVPDTGAAVPDTGAVVPDTGAVVPPDTGAAPPVDGHLDLTGGTPVLDAVEPSQDPGTLDARRERTSGTGVLSPEVDGGSMAVW